MLTSEYTIAYEPKVCEVYTPGEGFQPADLTLADVSGMGKTTATLWCFITDIEEGWICVNMNGEEECGLDFVEVEITCVEVELDDDCATTNTCGDGDDSGGGDDSGDEEDAASCSCSDAIPCAMEAEYDSMQVANGPSCDQFAASGGSAHFPWDELNGYWAEGNEPTHEPFGYIRSDIPGMLEALRALAVADTVLNIGGLPLTSGYRCPVGNKAVNGHARSQHMRGTGIDISTRELWGHLGRAEWEERYNTLAGLAEIAGFKVPYGFSHYDDHHLHLQL